MTESNLLPLATPHCVPVKWSEVEQNLGLTKPDMNKAYVISQPKSSHQVVSTLGAQNGASGTSLTQKKEWCSLWGGNTLKEILAQDGGGRGHKVACCTYLDPSHGKSVNAEKKSLVAVGSHNHSTAGCNPPNLPHIVTHLLCLQQISLVIVFLCKFAAPGSALGLASRSRNRYMHNSMLYNHDPFGVQWDTDTNTNTEIGKGDRRKCELKLTKFLRQGGRTTTAKGISLHWAEAVQLLAMDAPWFPPPPDN